ncbi:SAV_915 family protein [Streptomyces griseus]|uniref:SAV_915 family protein n=1 Tax=Streptomyces griseus TaxID=1911 RepID=UPI001F186A8E|nr:SAV_915 family protein [Streptomyces griseus]
MGTPIRSRLFDYVDPRAAAHPDAATPPEPAPAPPRSRLLDFVEEAPPERPDADYLTGPKPGVPAYRTPVFVPAHPRSLAATGAGGRTARVPFIVYELFEHPANGTVAFAFTTPERLVEALGESQPWVAASLGPLAEGMREQGVTVLLDPRVAPGHHNWQPADLAAYTREVR